MTQDKGVATVTPSPAMPRLVVDPFAPDPEILAQAAAHLRAGGLVAFPTETVYGLGADATDPDAVAAIYGAKGRPDWNPLIVHLPSTDAARALAADWPDAARALAERFWPGPLTLVLPKRAGILAEAVTAGLETVALRVPSHPVAQGFLAACGRPVAAPSANPSTRVSPTTAEHVAAGLGERVEWILDGGPSAVGIESTVVSLVGTPTLLRPGVVTAEELEELIGPLARPEPAAGDPDAPAPVARPSPGMAARHYSPAATLLRLGTSSSESADLLAELEARRARGETLGAILRAPPPLPVDHLYPMPDDPAGYARLLYAALHALDRAGCDVIVVDQVPDEPGWEGVRDRLRRAVQR